MKHQKTLKIINDPVYGFITVPTPFLCKLIEHPYVQRLRRIAQMGMGFLVYPGACHTRFQHALGALHLMQRAVETLRFKGTEISGTEAEALYAAILLHDVGHGPFSHAMERSVVGSVGHEELSVAFMRALNKEYNGKLTTAIRMFNNKYPRAFFHQLISGQLDVDRMDYLKRDSFYTGVAAGSISAKRLIAMLRVHGDQLVVEEKAVYSVEKFIIARRLMYWQVYLHKTGLVAEQLLVRLLQRAKQLVASGKTVPTSGALGYFLKLDKNETSITKSTLSTYALLDDADIFTAMKTWQSHEDLVLSKISTMLLNRDLLKIKLKKTPFSETKLRAKRESAIKKHSLSEQGAAYFVFSGAVSNQAYNLHSDPINLIRKNGKVVNVAKASDQLNIKALSQKVTKYYMCYPKKC